MDTCRASTSSASILMKLEAWLKNLKKYLIKYFVITIVVAALIIFIALEIINIKMFVEVDFQQKNTIDFSV